jgi:hypothetical protein
MEEPTVKQIMAAFKRVDLKMLFDLEALLKREIRQRVEAPARRVTVTMDDSE